MRITKRMANALCEKVVSELVGWKAFPAVLQAGGIELRGSSRFVRALEGWLKDEAKKNPELENLLVPPEYKLQNRKRIDYAFVRKDSVGQSYLEVDTVIEVKTNYLCQKSEISKRWKAANNQATEYGQERNVGDTYVLYMVVSPVIPRNEEPDKPRDAGWGYFRRKHRLTPPQEPFGANAVLGKFPSNEELKFGNMQVRIWAYLWKCEAQ